MADQPNQNNQSTESIEYLGLKLEDVSKQVRNEYKVSEKFMRSRREAWRKFLKLYINQRKNPKKVGDTLLFSTHQTILASLYKDRLDAEWMWREEEDIDRAEEVNAAQLDPVPDVPHAVEDCPMTLVASLSKAAGDR